MKRRSRGEQMLAAAGLAPPSSILKHVQKQVDVADIDVKSPPAKRARAAPKSGSPARSSQRMAEEQGSAPVPETAPKLPSELELLLQMFDAVRTGRMMLKRRSEKVTYNSVRHVVENMTKREFRVEHLAQIKYLWPESFDWQYIRVPSAVNPKQLETQLLLTFDRPMSSGAEGGGAGSVGRYNSTAEVAEFRAQLERFVRENPVDAETGKLPPVPQAPLPPRPAAPGTTPSRSASMQLGGLASPAPSGGVSAGGISGPQDAQALAPLAALASPGGSSLSGASPAMTRSRSRLGIPTMGPATALTPIPEGTPTRHTPTSRQPRRRKLLEDGGEQDGEDVVLEAGGEGDEGMAAEEPALELTQQDAGETATQGAGAAATPQSKGPRPSVPQTTPTSQQRPGDNDPRLARLHSLLSPAALQKIMQTEAAQAAQTPEAKRRAEMRRAVQLLPHGHELVRVIFGLQGPTVKPLTQVAQAMCERSTQRQGLTARDASNTLVALARAVPEFLRIEEPRMMADGSARPRSVVISRVPNINAIAAKLKALAADPDAAVQSIFERGAGAPPAAATAPSPSTSAGMQSRAPPGSPTAQLKPRALASALEEGAGAADVAAVGHVGEGPSVSEMPPPPPSARKRPPGLPLPPPSPAMHRGPPPSPAMSRGGQTPTRSQGLRGGGLFGSSGAAAAAGPPLAPHGTPTRPMPPVPAGGAELLQKLCKTSVLPAGKAAGAISGESGVEGSGTREEAKGQETGAEGLAVAGAGATPGRGGLGGRTPGRTAVQEAMLNSIRRSSAKRSCRRMLDADAGGESEEENAAEAEPKPRRLEELLGD
ncbi:hypothetical protein Agub_g2072 [Astrephomene gubernaculifera]|uniref:CDT1 Geminin-binding domain-containing protein n=1 Tax=Astrephomene gubernaculifera TaxID=47775 RepID=A0AAD3HHD4_9CHLO|nr:hypothetical protein Agub_g2072 [Astrephomene gubernaculifera]